MLGQSSVSNPREQDPLTAPGAALVGNPDLEFLHAQHSFGLNTKPAQGPFPRLQRWFRRVFLGQYLTDEQEFFAHLVRQIDRISKAMQLRQTLVSEEAELRLRGLELAIGEQHAARFQSLERRVDQIEHSARTFTQQVEDMDRVVRGLERAVALLGKSNARRVDVDVNAPAQNLDVSYVLLENRYRGSEEEISKRLSRYVQYFRPGAGAVLEIGAGRGELQELFRRAGIESVACELDAAMAEICREKGFDVRFGDAQMVLEQCADDSLGGVIAIQVVEHLPSTVLRAWLKLMRRKLRNQGKVVFETINTSSVLALCQNYFRDPTHCMPLHPETLRYILELEGFRVEALEKVSPYPQSAQLPILEISASLPPSWQEMFRQMNSVTLRLNELLYGYQDYYIVASREERV